MIVGKTRPLHVASHGPAQGDGLDYHPYFFISFRSRLRDLLKSALRSVETTATRSRCMCRAPRKHSGDPISGVTTLPRNGYRDLCVVGRSPFPSALVTQHAKSQAVFHHSDHIFTLVNYWRNI
jgi:hypothetical protein